MTRSTVPSLLLCCLLVLSCLNVHVFADDTTPTGTDDVMVSNVVQVDPTSLATLSTPNTVVLLAMYIPGLPKWTNHMSPVLEAVADHFKDDPRVVVAAGDCKRHRKFVKQYALRSFPTVFEFPPLAGAPLPFHVRYDPELTARDYVSDIENMLLVALSSNPYLDEVHSGMQAFMDSQAMVDHQIGWVGAAERHVKLAARERQWRRHMLKEDVAEPDPEEELKVHKRRIKAMEMGIDPNSAEAVEFFAEEDAKEEEKKKEEEAENEAADADTTTTTTDDAAAAPTVDEAAEKAALDPLRYAANQALLFANVQQAKVKFYQELLDKVAKHGSAIIARQLHTVTNKLYRNHEFMTEEVRDELLMQLSVLNSLASHLLGE